MEQFLKIPPQPKSRRDGPAAKDIQEALKDTEKARQDVVAMYRYLYEMAQTLGPGLEKIKANGVAPTVGQIVMFADSTDPNNLWPGTTWERIQDRFLLAAGTHEAGSTGGAETVQLTQAQLPRVTGHIGAGGGSTGSTGTGHGGIRVSNTDGVFSVPDSAQLRYSFSQQGTDGFPSSMAGTQVLMDFGGDQAHDNMPPYLAVFVWKRTA